jgi:hypothetical protein
VCSRRDLAPVFVVGPPRSGGKLLAWGLAQHPDLELRPGGSWLGPLAATLGPLYRAAVGETGGGLPLLEDGEMEDFLAPFGRAVAELLAHGPRTPGEPGEVGPVRTRRWVDGDPGNAFHIYGISRLVPGARFIHVVRSLGAVTRHLATSRTPDASYFTERSGAEAWLRHVRACLQAEQALGSEVTLRVRHRDLASDPEKEVRRCLAFLGESFHPACVRPFRGMRPDPEDTGGMGEVGSGTGRQAENGQGVRSGSAPSRLQREAEALSRSLLAGEDPVGAPAEGKPASWLRRAYIDGEIGGWAGGDPSSPVERIRGVVRAGVPEGTTVAVVSRGDEELVRLPRREGWHFPQVEGGVYAGHHPADSAAAIAQLEELRERGADFLLIPCTSFWWVDHYEGLRRHLEAHHRLVAFHEDLCLLFALAPGKAIAVPESEGARFPVTLAPSLQEI